jgi:nucleoid DNA-binding protein
MEEENKVEEIILQEEKIHEDNIMNTEEFVAELSERAGFTKSDTKVFLNTMQEIFEDAILQNVSIRIRGFLNLIIKDIKGFTGVNAYKTRISGQKVVEEFSPSKKVVITAGINLRDLLREPDKKKIQNKKVVES